MTEQLYYEDISVGDPLPTVVKRPTPRQLVMWAGAAGEFSEMHYDKDYAQEKGFPGIIVHGMLAASFLGQMITDWMGDWGDLKQIKTSNRQFMLVNEDIICKGVVAKKYVEDSEHYVDINMWVENSKGEKCVSGAALVVLPERASATPA